MKFLISAIVLLSSPVQAAILAQNSSENSYSCRVFEPNSGGGQFANYRVNSDDSIAIHNLQDGIHYLEIRQWSWILNVSLHKKGVVPEVLGGATTSHIKLRAHEPDASVECKKE